MEAPLSCRPLSSEDGRGRPVEMDGGKRRNIYIDAASWETALCLGDGNASVGIRKALALASEKPRRPAVPGSLRGTS